MGIPAFSSTSRRPIPDNSSTWGDLIVLHFYQLGAETRSSHNYIPSGDNDLFVDLHGMRLPTVNELYTSRYDSVTRGLVVEEDACDKSLRQDLGCDSEDERSIGLYRTHREIRLVLVGEVVHGSRVRPRPLSITVQADSRLPAPGDLHVGA